MTKPNRRKSVILLTVDCLRADHVGCYGYNRSTSPNIDELSKQDDCTRFEFGYSNSPATAWAFQSILTGVWGTQVGGIDVRGLPKSGGRTLAEQFREAGYRTGGFVNNGWVSRDHHADRGFETFVGVQEYSREEHPLMRWGSRVDDFIGSQHIRERVLKPIHTVFQSRSGETTDEGDYRQRVTDTNVCNDAIEWIREREKDDEPYFAWIHFMDAHTPYSRWNDHLQELRGDADVRHVVDPINDVRVGEEPPGYVIDAYDAGIRSADEQIGRVLEEVPNDTIVAITGDHGEEFGRYGEFHNISLHSSMTQVPLIIRAPEFTTVSDDGAIAQHIDISPTLAGVSGVEPHETWVGQSLHNNPRREDDDVLFCLSTHKGIRADGWKYIESPEYADGLLYRSSHGQPDDEDISYKHPDRCDKLKSRVEAHVERMNDNQLESESSDDNQLSETVKENLKEIGYIEN